MEETSHVRESKFFADQLERPHQHDGGIPSGNAMVLEAIMICIENSEWPPHCFSNEKTLPWINLLRQCSSEHHRAPAGQAKIPTVSTQVAPSSSQASAGLMLIPTKARGLLSGTMIRGTLTRVQNQP